MINTKTIHFRMKASVYGKSSDKCLDESLMNNIEPDEVEDVNEENDVSIEFSLKIKTSERKITDNEYVKSFCEHMRFAAERFRDSGYHVSLNVNEMKNDVLNGEIKIQRYLDIYDFCNLFVQMFYPKDCNCFSVNLDIKLEVTITGDDYMKCTFGDRSENKTLSIYKTSMFLSFFHELFPEETDDVIIKSFVSAFKNWKNENEKVITICFDFERNDKTYFIYTNGNMLSGMHFFIVFNFNKGVAIVRKNGKFNFIDTSGNYISEDWFDLVNDFNEGFAVVNKDGVLNFIDTSGNYILTDRFDIVDDFHEGFAKVEKHSEWNFIDTSGKLISKEWFNGVEDFHEGFARVKKHSEWNFIDTSGKLISKDWFDGAYDFQEGFAIVKKNGNYNYNFIDTTGNYISKEWFNGGVEDFHEGFARVWNREYWKMNFIDRNGNLLFREWFDYLRDFHEGFAKVEKESKWNFIDKKGNLLYKKGMFDKCEDFKQGVALVMKDGKYSYLNTSGELICDYFDNRFSVVRVSDDVFKLQYGLGSFIDSNGELVSLI